MVEVVRIVALTDDPKLGEELRRELPGDRLTLAPDLASARRALARGPAVLLLADDERLRAVGALIDEVEPGTPIVVLDAEPDQPALTAAIETGRIADVVALPWRPGTLRAALARARRMAALADEVDRQRRAGEDGGRLHRMIDSMADGLLLADLSSDTCTINIAARHMLGIPADQAVTRQYLKDRLGFYPFDLVVASRPSGGAPPSPLREELHVNGQVLSSIVTPVLDEADDLVGVVVVLRDITEDKEAARRQQEFISLVSHELRTPLTSITGALDIVLSDFAGKIADKQRRYLQMARDSCKRLNLIVDDLLDVARSEAGKVSLRLQPLALDQLGHDVAERFRSAAEAKEVELEVSAEGEVRILGDADRLTQVLNNLISNAIKFTPLGGRIIVEVFGPRVAAGHVGVSVFNNGEPIAEEERERIFDKIDQLSATRRLGGTGLGLATSRAIVEAHSGRIWVESASEGTKFVFTLPAAPTEETAQDDKKHEPDSAPTGERATVLLVDDDPYSHYILKGILMAAGHDVVVAEDADTALGIVRARPPKLAIIDADMQRSDPLALVEIFEHDPDCRKVGVVLLGRAGLREQALAAGADEVVDKPIDPARLRIACARLIAESGRARAPRILVVDDEPTIRSICRDVLENAGYQVRTGADGESAIVEARWFKPDLLLIDVMMRDMDGFAAAERFRAEPATQMTPIIFLSARADTADKVRAFRIGAEDYIVKPFDAAELVARVSKALERHSRELGASPTTQLPGSDAIEAEIERRLADGGDHAFCYLDLDNLKAFNDYYGYAKADGMIRQTGALIRTLVAREGNPGDFIGHIAGDDFVFITTRARVDQICRAICASYGRLAPFYYDKVDRERGYIETKDRFGQMRQFPIMSLSIAAVTLGQSSATTFSELAAAAAEGKKLAKAMPGNTYVRDGVPVIGEPAPSRPATVTGY